MRTLKHKLATKLMVVLTEFGIMSCQDVGLGMQMLPQNTENETDRHMIIEESEHQPFERSNLILEADIGEYSKGSQFTYSGTIKNNTRGEQITIDNSNKNSIEYKLLRGGQMMSNLFIDEAFKLKLNELGSIKIKHENDNLQLIVNNATLEYQGKTYNLFPPLNFSKDLALKNATFSASGMYQASLVIRYSKNGENLKATFKTDGIPIK